MSASLMLADKNIDQMMIKLKTVFCGCILVLVMTKCTTSTSYDDPQKSTIEVMKIDPQKDKGIPFKSVFDTLEIIRLESTDACMLPRVVKMDIHEGQFYLLGGSPFFGVYTFDEQGDFSHAILKKGKGPGEYAWLDDFCINQNTSVLELVDGTIEKLLRYSFQGELVDEQRMLIQAGRMYMLKSGKSLYDVNYNYNHSLTGNLNFNFICYDPDKKEVVYKALPFTVKQSKFIRTSFFNSFSSIDDTTIAYITPYNDTIYHFVSDKYLQPKYYVDFGSYKMDPEILQGEYRDIAELQKEISKQTTATRIGNVIETNDLLAFSYSFDGVYDQAFYLKQSKELIFGRYVVIDLDGVQFEMPFYFDFMPLQKDDDHIYFLVDAYGLKKAVKRAYDANKTAFIESAFYQPLKGLASDDNPLIFKCKIKK